MARMLCVLGMIFVHVPDGQTVSPIYAFNAGGLGFFLEGLLVEGPGRASAALLSVVSGYLAAFALLRVNGSVFSLYKRRFTSIVLPMVFWGGVTYMVYLLVSQTRPTFISEATTLLDNLNIIFFITEMPMGATMHLGFLRDLFVCILLAPILIPAVQRMPWFLLTFLGLFYLFEHEQSAVIVLRPLVLFAFTIGLTLAVRKVRLDAWDKYCPLFIVMAVFSTAIIMLVNGGAAANLVAAFSVKGLSFSETVLYPLGRLSGSLAIWTFLPVLMGGRFQRWVMRNSPYVFATFCSHYLMLTVLFFALWMPAFGDRGSDMFFIWFLAAPLVSMAIAIAIVHVALKFVPPLATLITGGRLSPIVDALPQMARRRSDVLSNQI
jgi:succinoglycan biosynthesis protein ExoH